VTLHLAQTTVVKRRPSVLYIANLLPTPTAVAGVGCELAFVCLYVYPYNISKTNDHQTWHRNIYP